MLVPNLVPFNTLLSRFVSSHQIDRALGLFNTMARTDARSWNTIISGLARTQRPEAALAHFVRMARSPVRPDNFTYSTILPCCDLHIGRQIHAQTVKASSISDPFISTNLLKMYAEAGVMGEARKVFDGMPERDSVSWNVMVSCYSKFGMGGLCRGLFQQMVREGKRSDEFTFAIVLNEFANRSQIFEGMQVHSLITRSGFSSDRFTCNALLNLYSRLEVIDSAATLFDEMAERDVVSWTAMITGLVVSGRERDAFKLFQQMRRSQVEPNSFTFGGLLGCCAGANSLEMGKQLHALALQYRLEVDVVVGSAVVDMYLKCGQINDALRLFKGLPERDLVSWNVMICGLAQNGQAIESLQLFDEMVGLHQARLKPNHVTFVGVLTACSHGGLVYEGCKIFDDMIREYSIDPLPEHYGCIIDILARAGLLEEAEDIVLRLPFNPDEVIWGALLGACRRHRNSAMAKRVAERLVVGEPTISSSYVLLANTYTETGEWNDASEVREAMCSNGSRKVMGVSWIEIRGNVHYFASGHAHSPPPHDERVFEVLQRLWLLMLEEGYEFSLNNW